jgi:predicted LPLAT superfamily acyltransferase
VSARSSAAEWRRQGERGSGLLLRSMAWFSLHAGRGAARAVLRVVVAYFFLFAPRARRHSRRYLERALGRRPRARDWFRHLMYFATCIHDRVFLLNGQFERFEISVEGEDVVRTTLEAGRGVLLLGAHVGSFEVMRSIGRRHGLEVAMAMYENNARQMAALVQSLAPARAPDIIPLGRLESMLEIAERLRRGSWVGMLADRTLGDEPTERVDLLGGAVRLPLGPLRVAALARCPVLFMLGLHRGANRYHVVFERLADFGEAAPRAAMLRTALERYAALLERYCHSDPYNWYNFFDYWQDDACAG